MKKEIDVLKEKNWSLNLEDPYYEANAEEMLHECMDAIKQTKEDCYVNLVTPGSHGDPRVWLIPQLTMLLEQENQSVREIRYIDECGCGGYVTRAYC